MHTYVHSILFETIDVLNHAQYIGQPHLDLVGNFCCGILKLPVRLQRCIYIVGGNNN